MELPVALTVPSEKPRPVVEADEETPLTVTVPSAYPARVVERTFEAPRLVEESGVGRTTVERSEAFPKFLLVRDKPWVNVPLAELSPLLTEVSGCLWEKFVVKTPRPKAAGVSETTFSCVSATFSFETPQALPTPKLKGVVVLEIAELARGLEETAMTF